MTAEAPGRGGASRLRWLALASALTSMVGACSAGGDGGVPVAEDARFFVDGEPVANLEAVRDALPIDVVVPSDLPGGWEIVDATAVGPQTARGADPSPQW